jgi:SAM-dependent methyltransferase
MSPDPALTGLLAGIGQYYDRKIGAYGATPLGVDWSCAPTQELRFLQLLKLCDFSAPFSLNDLGCGYGALIAFLKKRHSRCQVDYLGVDISAAMVNKAGHLWRQQANCSFVIGGASPRIADYSVASGIFNVQQDIPLPQWIRFVEQTLSELNATSRHGFAVNFLAPPQAGMAQVPGLYRTAAKPWLDYCRKNFARNTEVLEGYGMLEFTLIVRE